MACAAGRRAAHGRRGAERRPSSAQAYVLILAGYETTASALAFAMYLLSANPAKRDALLAEVDRFGRARVPTLLDLDRRARPTSASRMCSAVNPAAQRTLLYRARPGPHIRVVRARERPALPGRGAQGPSWQPTGSVLRVGFRACAQPALPGRGAEGGAAAVPAGAHHHPAGHAAHGPGRLPRAARPVAGRRRVQHAPQPRLLAGAAPRYTLHPVLMPHAACTATPPAGRRGPGAAQHAGARPRAARACDRPCAVCLCRRTEPAVAGRGRTRHAHNLARLHACLLASALLLCLGSRQCGVSQPGA